MICKLHLLTTAIGMVVLIAGAGADDSNVQFQNGLSQIGASVRKGVHPRSSEVDGAAIMVLDGFSYIGNTDDSVIQRVAGSVSPEANTGSGLRTIDLSASGRLPEDSAPAVAPTITRVVPLEAMLNGHSIGEASAATATVRLPEVIFPPRISDSTPASFPESVIATDYVNGESGASSAQLPAEGIPPAPPATIEITPTESVEPEAVPAAPLPHAGTHAPLLRSAVIDPRYQSVREDSVYTATCQRCGRLHCHCTYAPFGDAVRSAFGRQIHLGSAELMTLYAYDFHSAGTPLQSELTSRGSYQLDKIVTRLQYTPSQIKIETTGAVALDTARRMHVVEALGAMGIPDADGMVVTVRAEAGRTSVEMLETSNGLLDSIQRRGRTIQGGGSATFSGGAQFGQ